MLACQISVRQIHDAHDTSFNDQFSNFVFQLQSRRAIDVVELYHFEQQNGVILRLYENGQPVIPALPQKGGARQGVIELAEAQISPAGAFHEVTGKLNINSPALGDWQGEYRVVSAGSRAWYGVLMLKTEQSRAADVKNMVLRYTAIFVGAFACLALISRLLAEVAAKPVQAAYQQQLEFTAAAGHDLRTPVSIIKSSAQIILKTPTEATANAHKIVNESNRLARLVNDLLMLSASEAKLLQVNVGEVDVESVLICLFEQFTPLAAQRRIKINLEFPENTLPKAKGDSERIYQILSTFIENAFEYGSLAGPVDLLALAEKRHILIKVSDHGPGISDEQKPLVFNRFYRADKSRTKKEHFGLGLSIAHQLAAVQNAAVFIEDTPGGGATFVLKLKIAKNVKAAINV